MTGQIFRRASEEISDEEQDLTNNDPSAGENDQEDKTEGPAAGEQGASDDSKVDGDQAADGIPDAAPTAPLKRGPLTEGA